MNEQMALVVIDVQEGIDDPWYGQRNNPQAEDNIGQLLAHWRNRQWPVIHVHHSSTHPDSPLHPDHPGHAVKAVAEPLQGEARFSKSVNSAFIGTGLEDHLREQGLNQLVVAGLTTDHCVSTSVRMAANLGYEITLAGDATATHDRTGPDGVHYNADQMHAINLASLHGEFCQVRTTDTILNSITHSPQGPGSQGSQKG